MSPSTFRACSSSPQPIWPTPSPNLCATAWRVIELPGYTEQEKLQIAVRYLLPRQVRENGIPDGMLTVNEEAIREIIRSHTHEAGVRNLERSWEPSVAAWPARWPGATTSRCL